MVAALGTIAFWARMCYYALGEPQSREYLMVLLVGRVLEHLTGTLIVSECPLVVNRCIARTIVLGVYYYI